ncbi:glycosyltransferase family 4 protein [bacterium]|nr:glycosyltransferase family 4 protein [bacterium]
MKRILYVHHGVGLGGAPLSLLYLVKNLDREKYEPHVLFMQNSEAVQMFKDHGITVHGPINRAPFSHSVICWFKWYHPHRQLRAWRDSIKIWRTDAELWLNKIQPDLVHLNSSAAVWFGLMAKRMEIPVVCHVREPLARGYLGVRKNFLTRAVGRCATKIVPVCRNDSRPWRKSPKVEVIYNAASPEKFKPVEVSKSFLEKHRLKPSDPKILYVGGLSMEKGALHILRVFKRIVMRKPQVKLLLAGYWDFEVLRGSGFKGFLRRNLAAGRHAKKVQKLLFELVGSLRILGPVHNMPEVMSVSDVLVFPAQVGHFARPVIEAGFVGKPVVASKLPPLDELVIDKKTGFLVNPRNEVAWCEKLCNLLGNRELRERMGAAGLQQSMERFSLSAQALKIDALYERILG